MGSRLARDRRRLARPAEAGELDAVAIVERDALLLEELPLHRRAHRIEEGHRGVAARAGAAHAVPRDIVHGPTERGEGVTHLPGGARPPRHQGDASVGRHPPARDAPDDPIVDLPSGGERSHPANLAGSTYGTLGAAR